MINSWQKATLLFMTYSHDMPVNEILLNLVKQRSLLNIRSTWWLKIKYPTRQYAISPQLVVCFWKFLKLL